MVLPEPFTAVAASLGLLSTLFGLLVTSVRTIHEIGEDFRHYQLELNLLSNKVDDVLQKVEHIDRTWVAGTSFGEDLYTKIFGEEAAAEVVDRAELVEEFSQVVLRVFRKGYDVETWRDRVGLLPQNTSGILRPEDSLAWKDWAEQVFRGFAQRVRVENVLDSRAVKRVAFAMLRRADLAKKVKSLEESMQSFESCLQNHFRRLPNICEKPSGPDREFFKSLVQLTDSHKDLADRLSCEYHATSASFRKCGIYLAEEERKEVWQDLVKRAPIHFELCMSTSLPSAYDHHSRDGDVMRIHWPGDDDVSKAWYAEAAEPAANISLKNDFSSDALSDIYKALEQWTHEYTSSYRKFSEDERYSTMMRLFISTNLLWSTPWVDQVSVFNLQRHQTFDTEARISMWHHMEDPVDSDPDVDFVQKHSNKSFYEGVAETKRRSTLVGLARLGLVICDIALCYPIILAEGARGPLFTYRAKVVDPDLSSHYDWRRQVPASVLVQDVEKSMPGLRGAEVLSALCFPVRSMPSDLSYIDVCGTLDSDHERLERFYQEFLKQRETQKPRTWFKPLRTNHDAVLHHVKNRRLRPFDTSDDKDASLADRFIAQAGSEQQQNGRFIMSEGVGVNYIPEGWCHEQSVEEWEYC